MGGNVKAHLALLFTAVIAGFNYSISKIVMPEHILPSAIIVMRGIAATFVFGLVHLFSGEKIDFKNDFIKILACAFFGIAANQLLFYEGLNLTTPINASLLQCCVPVFVLIFAVFAKEEQLTFKKGSGITLGALGAVLLLISSSNHANGPHLLGDTLVILNAISYGIFLVILKPLMTKYSGLTIVAWIFFLGTFFTIPFGYNEVLAIKWASWPFYAYLSLGFILLFATIIAYYFNVSVLKQVNPSVAGIYIYLQPVLTTLIAVALGKDVLTWEKTGFSVLIFAGVFLVSKRENKQPPLSTNVILRNDGSENNKFL